MASITLAAPVAGGQTDSDAIPAISRCYRVAVFYGGFEAHFPDEPEPRRFRRESECREAIENDLRRTMVPESSATVLWRGKDMSKEELFICSSNESTQVP